MKLTKLLLEYPGAFTPRPEDEWDKNQEDIKERRKKRKEYLEKMLDPNVRLQNYIDNGSQGDLELIHDPEDPDIWVDGEEEDDEVYYYSKLTSLPDNFTVNGDLIISHADNLEELPRNLVVKGNLWMFGCGVKELPADLKVEYGIYASASLLERIPDNFTVNGDLDLSFCKRIERLPDNLTIYGKLNLRDCKNIKDLPKGLTVDTINVRNSGLDQSPLLPKDNPRVIGMR